MNGQLFRVRHKEWRNECFSLMAKTLPWLVLLILPIAIGLPLLGSVMKPVINSLAAMRSPVGDISAMILIFAFLGITAFVLVTSYFAHGSMILIHRIDQGMKKDPITAIWYLFHDKLMWKDHLRFNRLATLKIAYTTVVFFGFCTLGTLITGSGHEQISDSQQQKIDAAKAISETYNAFFSAYPLLEIIKIICWSIHSLPVLYLMYRETFGGFAFNSFMQANSYKSSEQCIAEGRSAQVKLREMKLLYLASPIGMLGLLNLITPEQHPVVDLVMSIVSAAVTLYVLHMYYIIGRDYWIGPPAKQVKEKKESISGHFA
jgi:hypothetical protein